MHGLHSLYTFAGLSAPRATLQGLLVADWCVTGRIVFAGEELEQLQAALHVACEAACGSSDSPSSASGPSCASQSTSPAASNTASEEHHQVFDIQDLVDALEHPGADDITCALSPRTQAKVSALGLHQVGTGRHQCNTAFGYVAYSCGKHSCRHSLDTDSYHQLIST